MFAGVLFLAMAPLTAVAELPPGAPVPGGQYPRLSVTREEIQITKHRAADEPAVRLAIERLVTAGRSEFHPPMGEVPPFDDAANDQLIHRAVQLGYAAILADRKDWARRAGDILVAYADVYPKRPANAEGRVHRYSLHEAIWVCQAATAADLVFAAGVLSEAERGHVMNDLLRSAAITVMTDRRSRPGQKNGHHQCYNFQAWHCAAVGLVGFLIEDRQFIDWAIDGQYGFRHMISHDVRDDGLFWERSPSYQLFVIQASAQLCEAAARAGIDLWNLQVPDDLTEDEWGSGNWTLDDDNGPKSFRMMLATPFDLLLPNLEAPRISDGGQVRLASFGRYLELGYRRSASSRIAAMLRLLASESPVAPPGWATFAPEGSPEFSSQQEQGRHILVIQNGSNADRGDWYSPKADVPTSKRLAIRLRYRTIGCKAQRPFRVRLVGYCDGTSRPDQCVFLDLPPSEQWTTVERVISMPPDTDQINVEAFLWKAAGRVEMTEVAVRARDGLSILSSTAFAETLAWHADGTLPWNFVTGIPHGPEPPEDARFGTTGLRRAGCSLFPATGVAVLREKWLAPKALGAVLSYGPYGGGHGHPAMLEMIVQTDGTTALPALGTADYATPLHGTWTNTTLAHNTVVADRQSQWPRSAWGHDTAARQVRGRLLAFHADQRVKLVRAQCADAYEDMELDRTLLMVDGIVVDLFRVTATDETEHHFDYVLHGLAPLVVDEPSLVPRDALGDSDGYQHLSHLQVASTSEAIDARFGESLRLITAPVADTEVITAMGLGIGGTQPLPVLLLSRNGRSTLYVVAMQSIDDDRVVSLSTDAKRVTLGIGSCRWRIDLPEDGGALLRCGDVRWSIGIPGVPTRRVGSNPRTWEPVRTGLSPP